MREDGPDGWRTWPSSTTERDGQFVVLVADKVPLQHVIRLALGAVWSTNIDFFVAIA